MKLSEKKLNIKSIILITVILPVIVILVSSVAIYFTAKSVQPGSVFDTSVLEKTEQEIPQTNEEALSMLTSLVTDAVNSNILKFSGNTNVEIQDITCKNENIGEIFSFLSGSFSSHLASFYEPSNIKYGEDASLILKLLPESVPDSFTADITDGILTLELTFEKVFKNMYFSGTDKTAVMMFSKENESVFSCAGESLIPGTVKYALTADTTKNRIVSFSVNRSYTYSSTVTFVNTLQNIGTTTLSMKPVFTEKYDFSFAGIEIEEEIKTLDKNGYDTLTVTPFTEAELSEDEFSLKFISSDPTVAAVDENGQVTAVKESDKTVVITVELQYLGKTFTDTCLIYVVKEVEKITVSDTELSLKTGGSAVLTAEVSPADATIKTVNFHSSDENVVKVNSEGEITAISGGTATVTAYSEQGFIAAECTVTVTE